MRFSCTSLALLAAFAIPVVAHSANLGPTDMITITNGVDTLTFTTPASPTPSFYSDGEFELGFIPVTYNGHQTNDDISFYSSDNFGGFGDNFFSEPFGGQYFTGDVSSPTFTLGTFNFEDSLGGLVSGTITISGAAISSTPEPSSLFLFGTGALGLAGVARRRLNRS